MKAVIVNDTSNEHHLGCTAVIESLKKLCAKNGIEIVKLFRRDKVTSRNSSFSLALDASDFVIINGEGTFHRSPELGMQMLEVCKDKPSVLINTVWEKVFVPSRELLRNVLLVSVRESLSYEQITKVVDAEKVTIVPDLIFYADIRQQHNFNIGYGDSVMGHLRGSLRKNRNYFPMQVRATEPDLLAYVGWLKSLSMYVTGRFHGICLAAMVGTSFLAFPSNSHKVEGLLKDMGCEALLLNSFDEIDHKRKLASELIGRAKKYAETAPAKIDDLFTRIVHKVRKM